MSNDRFITCRPPILNYESWILSFSSFSKSIEQCNFQKRKQARFLLRYVKEKHKNSKQWLANFPPIVAKSCESSIMISLSRKQNKKVRSLVMLQVRLQSSQQKSDVPETTFWKRRKGWGRHFTITTTTCFDWWKFPQTQTRVIQSDIYVPKCWVDLSFNSRVILDFFLFWNWGFLDRNREHFLEWM